ncbi:hypothetical protein [Pontibacter anaerobius]|uniref:Uncharacterized protein n=1 Tax=Pontibacter anaerobius TaxID=2993940 RepID=A0ABT3RCI2_9BACT|nr:hypothetical protein [Pontibacter anaerobius]MCX2738985.1 hypothetical protein [Pontibacter anaerobius]
MSDYQNIRLCNVEQTVYQKPSHYTSSFIRRSIQSINPTPLLLVSDELKV